MPNRLIRWVEDVITALTRFAVSRDLPDYCDLQTVVRLTEDDRIRHPELSAPYIMVTQSGDYLTVYEIAGSFRESDDKLPAGHEHAWQGRLQRMSVALTTHYRRAGHRISVVHECDPAGGKAEVRRLLAPQYRSIKRTGLDLKYQLDEQVEKLAPWVNRERTWLVCYTGRGVLAGHELRDENVRLSELVKFSPTAAFGQNPLLAELIGLKIRHDAFLTQVERALGDSGKGVLLRRIDAHEAGRILRTQTDPGGTGEHWQPLLPDDPVMPRGVRQGEDATALLAPWLNFQVMGSCVDEIRNNLLKINGIWHGTLAVNLGPQNPQSFARLRELIPRSVPFRLRQDLMPGGMRRLGGKQGVLSFTEWVPGLKPIFQSVSLLAEREQQEPVCVMTITAATWGDTPEDVTRNLTLLQQALTSWGVCGVTQTFGDPVKAWVATLTASSVASGPCLLFPPLSEALNLMPLTRPASAWNECYDPHHPMTRTDSRRARMELLRYVSRDCKLVTGCETGHDAAVPFLHYFEGMLSLGPYRVPDSGRDMARIWTDVPARVARFQLGHAYRLPLWELVYHDCVVAQWYWGDYNNKLPALWDKRDLFNVLYGTPPMFMFDRKLWSENKARFVQSYQNTAPSARAAGYSEMTDHRFLTPDRSVQQTTFANGMTVTVNFGETAYRAPGGETLAAGGFHVGGLPR